MGENESNLPVHPPSDDPAVTTIVRRRVLNVHPVLDSELDQLENANQSLKLSFFAVCIGAFITSLPVLFTDKLPGKTFDAYLLVTLVSGVLGAYFWFSYRQDKRTASTIAETIRRRDPLA